MRANKMTYNHEIGTYSLLRYKQFKFPLGCRDKIKNTPEKNVFVNHQKNIKEFEQQYLSKLYGKKL